MLNLDLPPNIAAWNHAVWQEVQTLKNFGLDVLSFPIWDLEGLACIDDPDIGVVMSLHTSYALARPHKPEWAARPLYVHHMVRRMIAAEWRGPWRRLRSCSPIQGGGGGFRGGLRHAPATPSRGPGAARHA